MGRVRRPSNRDSRFVGEAVIAAPGAHRHPGPAHVTRGSASEITGHGSGTGRTSRPVRRVLFRSAPRRRPVAAIHLGLPSPTGSSGLPAGSGGPPSNACAGRRLATTTLLTLLRAGFTEPSRSPGMLVGSYPTVSPSPAGREPPKRPRRGGGLFSVALSRGSPRVAVNNRPALWSPDVPRRRSPADAAAQPTRPS